VSYERKVGRMRQVIVKADGTPACEAIFAFGLFHLDERKLIAPTPEWSRAVGAS
jgi:hypothetical protein